jgi:hypothetical protein
MATARLLRRRLADHELWLAVDGVSMRPTIAPPAEVRVVARTRPRLGEVWAFAGPDGTVVVHRYERCSGEGFVFRGDGRAAADPDVTADVLIGRAVAVRDAGGQRRLGRTDQIRGIVRYGWRRAGRALWRGRG